jgi:protocatechuate 3,4-dioxygenase beta subunit
MSSTPRAGGRSRLFIGLVALLGVALLAGLVGLVGWWLRPGGDVASGERAGGGPGAPALVKGTGTSWLEEIPTEASAAMEGVVLDREGKPVDGARVTLGRAFGRNEEAVAGSYMQPRAVAVSAGGGRFRIEKLVSGEYTASATLEGWLPAHRGAITVKERETARVELRLEPGGVTLQGRILDVGGGGVGGARVVLLGRGMSAGRAPLLFAALADGEGRYRLAVTRGSYRQQVEAEGYATVSDEVFVTQGSIKDVRLVPAARLSGRVVERGSGQPVPEAEVSLTSALRSGFRAPRDVKADGEGRFQFSGLEPGTFEIMARKGAQIGVGNVVALAVAQALDGVVVEVDRGRAISGRVKDEKGAAVAGARVSASRDSPPFGQAARTRTNPDGSYALEGMLPGQYRLSATAEVDSTSVEGRAVAKLLSTDLRNVDLVMPAGIRVTGRVLTAQGQPVAGARVQSMMETSMAGGGRMSSSEITASADDGTFKLNRVAAGRLRLTARHDQHGTASLPPLELQTESKTVELRLREGASIAGVVRTQDGKPAPGVRVTALGRELRMLIDVQDVTAADGSYRLTGLPAGSITASARRGAPVSLGMNDEPYQKTVALGEGEDKGGVDLVIGPAGLVIRGTTQSPDGKPVSGAIVTAALERSGRAFRGQGRDLKAYSNLDGQWTLEDLNPGTYTIWASHPEHPEAELKAVTAGPSPVTVTFPTSASVAGVVVSADGKPIPHYSITVLPGPPPNEPPNDRRRRRMSSFDAPTHRVQSPDGAFELRRMAGGAHELAISTADGGTATQVINLAAGEQKTGVRIQVQAGLKVTGRVVEFGTGKLLTGVTVTAMGSGADRPQTDVLPDGTFVLEGAPAGEQVRLMVSGDSSTHVSEHKELEVKPGQTAIDAGLIQLLPGNQRERMAGRMGQPPAFTGLITKRDGSRLLVRAVVPDMSAARAGVNVGDLVVTVAGNDATHLGNGALSFLMSGKSGDTVNITVSTGGAPPRPVALTFEEPKTPPRSN